MQVRTCLISYEPAIILSGDKKQLQGFDKILMQVTILINKKFKGWNEHKFINKYLIKKITKNILSRFDNLQKIQQCELSLLLTDDKEMHDLNNKFRSKAKSTNILSFPAHELNRKHLLEFQPDLSYMYLGDVAFGYQVIKDEVMSQNTSFDHYFTHLLVHGILHLIGYDHENDEEAKIMQNLETDILKKFAIPSPY